MSARLAVPLPALGPVAQQVVGEHTGHHRLADGHGADADAGVVAALGRDFGVTAGGIDRALRLQDGAGRLDAEGRA